MGKSKLHKQRHYSKEEIINHLKATARENRMMYRSPWTAAALIMSYATYEVFGFKGERLGKLCAKVEEYEQLYQDGELDMQEVMKDLIAKTSLDVKSDEPYTEKDITFCKKGSYEYWITTRQLEGQNTINDIATRYMIFYYKALNEIYGYGATRCSRLKDTVMDHLEKEYQMDKSYATKWKNILYEEAGIAFENPVDPLTQKAGSYMTGEY